MEKTYLSHHGIKGQRWGIRRFQNEDGSLTNAGKRKYNVNSDGTVFIKRSYQKRNNIVGTAKIAIGAGIAAKGIFKFLEAKNTPVPAKVVNNVISVGGKKIVGKVAKGADTKFDFASKEGHRLLNKTVMASLIGAVIIGAGVKNFINANKDRTFNSTGMGGSPETFNGKPKTREQVLAIQDKLNKKS